MRTILAWGCGPFGSCTHLRCVIWLPSLPDRWRVLCRKEEKEKKMPGKPTKFVEEPSALLCPVCKKVFIEPVISIKCGHTFCRTCIEELIKNGRNCPLDDQECDSSQLVLNRAVMGQIEDLHIYCCHGLATSDNGETYEADPMGCKEVIRLGRRDEHESLCQFARVSCPIGGEFCGPLRKHQLERHMAACTRVPCPYCDFGVYVCSECVCLCERGKG